MSTSSPIFDRSAAPARPEEVLLEVTQMLVKVIGTDFLAEEDVGMQSSFSEDLCLESIQFVILAEELRAHYGEKVDFVAWLAGMDLDTIIALRVGSLVELIVDSINRVPGV